MTNRSGRIGGNWNGMRCLLAVLIALLFCGQGRADETLTLQGPSPRLIFDDNDGALQKWTVYGDDGGFEIETQSGSFKQPFRIAPTATAKLYIGGAIGIDTTDPQTKLHVYSNGPRTALRLEADNDVGLDANWDILADSEESLRFVNVAGNKFPLTIQNNAPNGSDRNSRVTPPLACTRRPPHLEQHNA